MKSSAALLSLNGRWTRFTRKPIHRQYWINSSSVASFTDKQQDAVIKQSYCADSNKEFNSG